jgi:DNA-binding transcriptional LysR family regulator
MMEKPLLNLKTLYYFTVLAEERHFGQAAKKIGIEQPPLSLQMKNLEQVMGTNLFDRSNRKLSLTAAGEALYTEAVRLIGASVNAVETTRRVGRGDQGILRVGFASSTIFAGIPEIIKSFKEKHPGITLVLRECSTASQLEDIRNGALDIGFIRETVSDPGIICRTIFREKFLAVLSAEHPFSQKTKIELKDLHYENFVLFPRQVAPALYDKVHQVFSKAKFYPNVMQETMEWQTIISLVKVNLGVSICPSSFKKLKIEGIIYKSLPDVKLETTINICIKKGNISPAMELFLSAVP